MRAAYWGANLCSDARRFLGAPGHEIPNFEQVVDEEDEHRVVQKDKDERLATRS
jgi:hypothetical protein